MPAATKNETDVKPVIVHAARTCVSPLNAPGARRANSEPTPVNDCDVMRVAGVVIPELSSVCTVNTIEPVPVTDVTWNDAASACVAVGFVNVVVVPFAVDVRAANGAST